MEQLHINNFAGINHATVELGRINIFIGPQASGKSVCVKLFFFFKEILNDLLFLDQLENFSKPVLRKQHTETFERYFPRSNWGDNEFRIRYQLDDFWMEVNRTEGSFQITYSPYYDKVLSTARRAIKGIQAAEASPPSVRERSNVTNVFDTLFHMMREELDPVIMNINYFIPAGRSFFAVFEKSFWRMISRQGDVDPFIGAFGQRYERLTGSRSKTNEKPEKSKEIEELVRKLICGTHLRVNGIDYIRMDGGRQIPLSASSSGQQEVLPLALMLADVAQSDVRSLSTIIIEEPEAHLYPSAQRDLIHLFSLVAETNKTVSGSSQYLITTHSPYILSALNNLMYAEKIVDGAPSRRRQVGKILGDAALVDASEVRAYSFGNRVEAIIDPESGLVKATILDDVSNQLAKEFGDLVDIMLEE